ncbi:MAG: response regulator [Anaerolineae bacterium]|nr:response regulator [Anaerolineae bacterium]
MAGETVLAIDDREDSLRFLQEYVLEPNGYKMLAARNGTQALQIILNQEVDLIISDLVMPQMGGLELLESLREKGLDIPAILMTFHGSEGTAVRAFRLGARDYIIKPFAIDEMLNAIDRALTESRLRQERDRLTQTVLKVNQQLESRVQELRFLYGIGRSVTSLRNIEEILNRIVEAAVYLTEADEGSLMLVDPSSGELYLRAARGMGEKSSKSFRMKIDDSIAGQVVRTGRPVMIGGVNEDDSFKLMTGYFVKALLNVPLKAGGRVIGVLAVNNKTTLQAFSDRHLNLLMALADYASIAIQNAQLYAKLSSDVNRARESSREFKKMADDRTAELEEANRQLLRTEKLTSLGYMAAGVAKEIDTPINAILDNLHQVAHRLEATDENRQLLTSLERAARHCRQVTQSLLDFAGQKAYQLQEANLNDIIEAAWIKFNETRSANQIEFVRGFDPQLPMIAVDRTQVEQALFYLIRHACRSMPLGGTLRVISRSVGAEVQVIINDTGEGISQKDLQHIFDPFYKTSHQAYGLELSISYAIVKRHQGTVEVESAPGQGTTFTIHLPRKV